MGNQPHNEFSLVAWSSTSYLGLVAPVIPCGSGAAEAPSVVRAVPRVKPAPAAVAAWSTRRRLSRERAAWLDCFGRMRWAVALIPPCQVLTTRMILSAKCFLHR